MPRVRKIQCNPEFMNFFLVDANFLANKYISTTFAPNTRQSNRIKQCQDWWVEIDREIRKQKARVFIPDVSIAEAYKTLAKKYYVENWFPSPQELNNARNRLSKDISTPYKTLRASNRHIRYHDISTSRDIIIAVDRFYEVFMKEGLEVSLPDLIILATAKYLLDFFSIPKDCLHIVTLDRNLYKGLKKIQELPKGYDPTLSEGAFDRIFE